MKEYDTDTTLLEGVDRLRFLAGITEGEHVGTHYQPKGASEATLRKNLADLQKELAEMKALSADEREEETIPDIQQEIASVKSELAKLKK